MLCSKMSFEGTQKTCVIKSQKSSRPTVTGLSLVVVDRSETVASGRFFSYQSSQTEILQRGCYLILSLCCSHSLFCNICTALQPAPSTVYLCLETVPLLGSKLSPVCNIFPHLTARSAPSPAAPTRQALSHS